MLGTAEKPIYLQDYKTSEFLIEHIDLVIELDDDSTLVNANLTVLPNPASTEHTANLVLDGVGLKLKSLILNDEIVPPDQYKLTDTTLSIYNVPAEKFNLGVQTIINPSQNTELQGLYKSRGNFTTQCEPEGFRCITYFLDRPDVMATYTSTIIADEMKCPVLLSNGNFVAKGKSDNGKHWIKWHDPFKKPSYLYALVAGNFDYIEEKFISMSKRTITLQMYAETGNSDKLQAAMESLKNAMRWDEKNYARECDLDVYKVVAIDDFNMGAMENKGLNIFNSKCILFSAKTSTDDRYIKNHKTIGHEYFHNWTGDRVTLRDWFQLCLKEGLTRFRDQSFSQDTFSAVTRINSVNNLRNRQFAEDMGPLAHAVQPQSYLKIDNFYTATIYEKGAEIFRMLQTTLGKDIFRKGMDLYFEHNDGQAVIIENFINAMEAAAAQDLSQFLLWFRQAGTPIITVEDDYDPQKQIYTLKLKQSTPPTPNQFEKKPLPIPIKMGLLDEQGEVIPLYEDADSCAKNETILLLRDESAQYHFYNVTTRPIPSLLRNFSAPVKLNYPYQNNHLQLLAQYDSDLFNSWDAGQRYITQSLIKMINNYKIDDTIHIDPDILAMYKILLNRDISDLNILTMMITLPTINELAFAMDVINIEPILAVKNAVITAIGSHFKDIFLHKYLELKKSATDSGIEHIGTRAFQNLCLSYLMKSDDATLIKLANDQFDASLTVNMTNTYAAISSLIHIPCAARESMLERFYQQWKDDPQVTDLWFELQSSAQLPDTLEKVKQLTNHEAFDIKNPNKVSALIDSFCKNFACFHAKSGEAYRFLADFIIRLDAINSNGAAGLVEHFAHWNKFDSIRKNRMLQELQRIAAHPGISENVHEIASKSLGNERVNSIDYERESNKVLKGAVTLHDKTKCLFKWYLGLQLPGFFNKTDEHPLLISLGMYEHCFTQSHFHNWLKENEAILNSIKKSPCLPKLINTIDEFFAEQATLSVDIPLASFT